MPKLRLAPAAIRHWTALTYRIRFAQASSLRHYHTVEIPKRDATYRCLSVPDEVLKKIQRSITEHLLVYMPISRYAMAYRYGGNIFRNAVPHTGKNQILKLDIHHFFDSIRYSSIKEAVFPSEIFSEPITFVAGSPFCYVFFRISSPYAAEAAASHKFPAFVM